MANFKMNLDNLDKEIEKSIPKMEREVTFSGCPPFVELFPDEKQAFSFPPPPKLVRHTSARLCLSVEERNDLKTELFPIPKLERQTNRPPSIVEVEDEELIADRDFAELCLLPEEEEEIRLLCTMPGCDKFYYYSDSDPSYGDICFDCEMNERRQELIDQENYPDDIPSYLRYRDSF